MDENGQPRDYSRTSLYVRAAAGLKLRDHKVQRLVQRMRSAMPWLQLSDIPMARSWAQLEVLGDQVYAALRAMGPLNSNGEARRLLDDFRRLRQTQAGLAQQLGMSPMSRSTLRLSSAGAPLDLAAINHAEISDSEAQDVINAGKHRSSAMASDGFAAQCDDLDQTRSAMPVSAGNAAEGDSEADADVDDTNDGERS